MQRPPFLEPNGFCFWKARIETYVKSKDIDLWQVIQKGDFYYEVEDSETKLMNEMSYELQGGYNTIMTSLKSLDPDYSSKNHVKSLALKVKVTREQTSDDSDSQDGSDEDVDEE
ncbi:hypothetical protein Tco_0989571 [Tanacetum coccineum]|uniref:DUF4219 domain-containing protein n=1 Tax=Tanacetum coccineum TaxID=301880 RepID=A0ABQ5EVD9_9ASTR